MLNSLYFPRVQLIVSHNNGNTVIYESRFKLNSDTYLSVSGQQTLLGHVHLDSFTKSRN